MQAHGDALSDGWPVALGLLEDVAAAKATHGRILRAGHECMELVIADFLPCLPKAQLLRALHTEACFVLQDVDVNTCYAAGLLLWRAADTLGCALQVMQAATAQAQVRPSQV